MAGDAPIPIQLGEMVSEIERELALRRRVYPRWVAAGNLKQSTADRQIAVLEAVLAELKPRETKERLL